MHPMIKPAMRRAWRDRRTVQFGVAPAHAVLLGPVDDATAGFLDLLDGTRSVEQLHAAAEALGIGRAAADRVLERLAAAGVLDDSTAERSAAAQVGDRLRADLAALSSVHREPGAGPRRLTARRSATVRVRGAGRVGALVANTLSAAGVGRVEVVDGGQVEPWETAPGGIPPSAVGERRESAARRAVHGARAMRPAARSGSAADPGRAVRLVVLTPRDGLDAFAPDPAAAAGFHPAGTPHLYGGVVEGTGVVGPLVLPGSSPCADCMLRERAAREPGWPLVVGQWRTRGRRQGGVPACDLALATVVAGATASYALSYLDGDGSCGAGYRVRFTLPHLLPETEPLAPHPECSCGAASVGVGRPPSAGTGSRATMTG